MRALLLSLPCLLALGAALPARAQTGTTSTPTNNLGNLTVATLAIGGEQNTASASATLYINAKHCADPDATVEVRVRGLGAINKPALAVWVGNNCNQNRSSTGGTSTSDCVFIFSEPLSGQAELIVPIPVGMLKGCEGTMAVTTWFMPMNTPESDTEVITDYGTQKYTVDTAPPPVPANVSGGSGESQIKVDWDSSGGDIQNYYVYWDTAIGSGENDAGSGECATSTLHEGAKIDPSETLPAGVGKEKTPSNATSFDLDGADIDGDMAGVAVQAVDLAGNASPLSETACIEVVETTGFWELYEQNGGDVEEGCACSLPGHGAPTGRAPWLVGSSLLALVALRRRRRA